MKGRKFVVVGSVLVMMLVLVAGWSLAQGNGPEEAAPAGALSLQGTVGTTFLYQGRLLDNGHPANGTYDFRFKLFTAETGGTQVGSTVTRNDVPVRDGLFSVPLDFGTTAFRGEARWLQVEVRPGTSTGSYTVLSPRQPIYAVPYALSLRPGAEVVGSTSATSRVLRVRNTGSGHAVVGVADGAYGYAGFFYNTADAGRALYARGGSGNNDLTPDIVLGGNSNTNDNGVIASDPSYRSSDIVLRTNDTLRVDLDADKSGEDADFEIRDKDGNLIFNVDESGTIQSNAVSRLFVPGTEAVPHAESRNALTLEYYGRGTVVVKSSHTGVQKIVIPIQIPAVLYGQPVRIADMRVHYATSNSRTYIDETYLYRQRSNGGYDELISSGANRTSITFTYYHLYCVVSQCRLDADASFLTATLVLKFGNTGDTITIGGIRLTLEHD